MTESVQDDLADVSVEVKSGEEAVLLVDGVHIAVSDHHQLFGSSISFLDFLVLLRVVVADHALEFLDSGFSNKGFKAGLVLLGEVFKTLLKESVARVLAHVSEVSDRLLEGLSVAVLAANIDNSEHNLLKHVAVGLVFVVLERFDQLVKSQLPVSFGVESQLSL